MSSTEDAVSLVCTSIIEVKAAHEVANGVAETCPTCFTKVTKTRLVLFTETVNFLEKVTTYLSDVYGTQGTRACVVGSDALPPIHYLLNFVDFLQQARDVLEGLTSMDKQLGEGFDMVDLALWRYCFTFEERSKHWDKPSWEGIENKEARDWWKIHWGDKYAVPFDDFYDKFIAQVQGQQPGNFDCHGAVTELDGNDTDRNQGVSEELRHFLRMFLNFPEDNYISTFKFNLLDQTLGPMTHVVANFEATVLGPGFVGLVTREIANELISKHFKDGNDKYVRHPLYLLRFSRTTPRTLVATVAIRKPRAIDVQHRLIDRKTFGDKTGMIRREDIEQVLASVGMKDAKPFPIRVNNFAAVKAARVFRTTGYDNDFSNTYYSVPDCASPSNDEHPHAEVTVPTPLTSSGGSCSGDDDYAKWMKSRAEC